MLNNISQALKDASTSKDDHLESTRTKLTGFSLGLSSVNLRMKNDENGASPVILPGSEEKIPISMSAGKG